MAFSKIKCYHSTLEIDTKELIKTEFILLFSAHFCTVFKPGLGLKEFIILGIAENSTSR